MSAGSRGTTLVAAAREDAPASSLRLEPSRVERNVSIAAGDDHYLVVWQGTVGIEAARIAKDGTLLDPVRRRIALRPPGEATISVAWNGETYLVTWFDLERGELVVATLDRDARVTAPVRTVAEGQFAHDSTVPTPRPLLSWNGHRFLIVYGLATPDGRVDTRGLYLDGAGTSIGTSFALPPGGYPADLGSAGGSFLLLSRSVDCSAGPCDVGLLGTLISAGRQASDPLEIARAADHPSVASDGHSYFVAWQKEYSHGDIYGRALTGDGVPEGDPFHVDTVADAPLSYLNPTVLFDGESFLVAIAERVQIAGNPPWNQLRLVRLTTRGEHAASNRLTWFRPNGFGDSAISSLDGEFLFVNSGHLAIGHPEEVDGFFGVRIDPALQAGTDAIPIAMSSAPQANSAMASNGDVAFLAWEETPASGTEIRGTLVGSDGATAGGESLAISTDGLNATPAVASDGSQFIVAFYRDQGGKTSLCTRRVSLDGKLIDPEPVVVDDQVVSDSSSTTGYLERGPPAIAWGGDRFLLVWTRVRDDGADRSVISGVFIDSDGRLDGERFELPHGVEERQFTPAVASSMAGQWLVVWTEATPPAYCHPYRCKYFLHIEGALVSTSGRVSPAFRVSQPDVRSNWPSITAAGHDALVVWSGNPNSVDMYANWNVYAARVKPSGFVGVVIPIAESESQEVYPEVALDSASRGQVYWLQYSHDRDDTIAVLARAPLEWNAEPAVVDPGSRLRRIATERLADGRHLLAHVRYDESVAAGGAERVFVRGFGSERRRPLRR